MDISAIDYTKLKVKDLFSGRKYNVPKYQRPFSWNEDNADKFWTDIFESEDDGDYFLGSLVFNEKDDGYEIIDGQQRITTISLFFYALYLSSKEILSDDYADKVVFRNLKELGDDNELFQILSLGRNNENFYNKALNTDKFIDFQNEFGKNNSSSSNKNIFEVVKFFYNKINKGRIKNEQHERERIKGLLSRLKDRVFVVELVVPSYEMASKLFEVLNNRGESLAQSDLIRNHLLSIADEQRVADEAILKWNKIEDNIGIDNLEKFLRYSSILLSRKGDMYERIKDAEELVASDIFNFLEAQSVVYRKLNDYSNYAEDVECRLLDELDILGVTQAYSVMLAVYSKYEFDEALRILSFIVNFTFRYGTICGKNPNQLERMYASLAYDIYNNDKKADKVIEEILTLKPSDIEFKEAFVNKSFKSTKIPRYILSKIENGISGEEKVVDYSAIHLEHIMPKNIKKWAEQDSLYEKLHEELLNNIGNMVILSKRINTSIKNSIFSVKKGKYRDSKIELIKYVVEKNNWTKDDIKNNADRYFNEAIKIWNI